MGWPNIYTESEPVLFKQQYRDLLLEVAGAQVGTGSVQFPF